MACMEYSTRCPKAGDQHARITWEQILATGANRSTSSAGSRTAAAPRPPRRLRDRASAPSVDGDYMASVLACGRAPCSARAAAMHKLKLLPGPPPPPEVTVPTTAGRKRPGIVVHRVKFLHPLDLESTTTSRSRPSRARCSTWRRGSTPAQLARACHEAWVRHGTRPEWIEACIERNPRKPGAAKLRARARLRCHAQRARGRVPRAPAPARRSAAADEHRLRGDKVDCHWPELGLTVELLGYRFHASRQAFEADVARRRRSSHLAFTWGDVFERAARTIAELRAAYASS